MINIKTQTKRATTWKEKIVNINLFCGDFQFGIVTSKYWGEFEQRNEPLIELKIEKRSYQIPMSEFISKLKQVIA